MQLEIRNDDMVTEEIEYGTVYDKVSEDVKAFVDTLTTEELINLPQESWQGETVQTLEVPD